MSRPVFKLGIDHLTPSLAMDIVRGRITPLLDEKACDAVDRSCRLAAELAAGDEPVYGVNTGFGPLCTTIIDPDHVVELQYNLLKSHSVGVGEPVPDRGVRLMLITKIHALAQGYSGIRLETLQRLLWHFENDILPVVPCKGSVGASGDLAPLAHLSLPLIGLGRLRHNGAVRPAGEVLQEFGLEPLTLGPKEGLGLINGTQFIVAYGILFVEKFRQLLDLADVIGALSLEGLQGSARPFMSRLHKVRPYSGSQQVAARLWALLEGSEILKSHEDCDRVQDPYSFRCMPAIHGTSRNAWQHVHDMLEIELNSVTDNPLLFSDGESVSGGNFHGQPLAVPLDYGTIAAAELGSVSERRSFLLLEGKFGLPAMLIKNAGLNSGFMIPQYTAAALVSENKTRCFPASADSIPTGMGQEDHVSMGSISARKAWEVVQNVEHILSVELLYAVQALDYRRPRRSSDILESIHAFVRLHVDHAEEDRVYGEDMEVLFGLISEGTLAEFIRDKAREFSITL